MVKLNYGSNCGLNCIDVEGTEEICLAKLQKHIDQLGDGVFGLRFSDPDGPINLLTDREDDLDRLAPQIDLVSYPEPPTARSAAGTSRSTGTGTGTTTTAAFKYWLMPNGMDRTWYELNSWSRLPRDHPHIVPFDSVVLDPVSGGVVGFTSQYVRGGTLLDNNATTRPFQFRWFRQLLSVVDDLNFRYGVMHQDIAARNLVINEKDNLRIFDFNYAIMIGKDYIPHRNDIKGVIVTLYEIITLDEHFREVPHEEQDVEPVLKMRWEKHPDVKLDADVQTFRDVLDAWMTERKARELFQPAATWEYWNWERPASYNLAEALAKQKTGQGDTKPGDS
ncbi:hypothetical protein VTG60DRAFT_2777 [Thermothelomyces hinnuleus]